MLSHPFESERLILRDITEADAPFVYAVIKQVMKII